MEKALEWIDSLSERTGKLVSFLLPGLALVEVYEVVVRYIFDSPTVWASELSAMLFGIFILLGGAYTLRVGGHVNMDIVYSRFSPKYRALMDMVSFLLFLAFIGVLLCKGWETAWRSIKLLEHDSTEWGPPLYLFKLMLPLGAFLILLQGLAKLARDVRIFMKGGE